MQKHTIGDQFANYVSLNQMIGRRIIGDILENIQTNTFANECQQLWSS